MRSKTESVHEYGVATDSSPNKLHRGPMSCDEAEEWLRSCPEVARDMFIIVRRRVSPWEPVNLV